MPYMYPDLNAARDMANAGAACIMPLGAPIGSNKGICTKEFIQILIDEIDLPIIVDAGIGRPSPGMRGYGNGSGSGNGKYGHRHSGEISRLWRKRSGKLSKRGRSAYLAGMGRVKEKGASASSPLTGFLQD